jgi:hypothetical protein
MNKFGYHHQQGYFLIFNGVQVDAAKSLKDQGITDGSKLYFGIEI